MKTSLHQQAQSKTYRQLRVAHEGGIGHYLYNQHAFQNERLEQEKQRRDYDEQSYFEYVKGQSSNKVSEEIVNEKLRQKLELIFTAFDQDNNGYITASEINLNNVNIEILDTFAPLLVEMENLQESLDRYEFVDSSLELYKTLTVTQRQNILQFLPDAQDANRHVQHALNWRQEDSHAP